MLPDELNTLIPGEPSYRGKQLFQAIQKGISSFSSITVLPKTIREILEDQYLIRSSTLKETFSGTDGTEKIQIQLHDGPSVEAVLLTDRNERYTACLSTQAGCAMGCIFCKTGTLGPGRNLHASEIVEQFLYLRDIQDRISNIVFMGMGEPLHNLEQVRKAVVILHHPDAHNIGLRKMTISTCGITEGIRDLADTGPGTDLAVSLNSGDDQVRSELMPRIGHTSLAGLKESLVYYQQLRNRRITLEYVLIAGWNDRPEDPGLVARFSRGLKVSVNLIPCNPAGNPHLAAPDNRKIRRFKEELETRGLPVVQRYSRGRGIQGACGQLGGSDPPK